MISSPPATRSGAVRPWGWPVLVFVLALNILKGIRMPGRWAVTHYLFTYKFGFIKRGLWGETLWLLLRSRTANYFVLAAVALAILGVFLILLVRLCRRLPPSADRLPLLLVLLTSPALAFFAHLVGYLEQIGYLLFVVIVAAAWSGRARALIALAAVAALVLPFVHEASILWFGALTTLAVLAGTRRSECTPRQRRMAVALIPCIWILSTGTVLQVGRVSQATADALRDDRIAFFEFRPRTDAFGTLTTRTSQSLRELETWWARPDVEMQMLFSLAVFAPGAIYMALLALRRARSIDDDRSVQRLALALILLATIGPLFLNILGRDEHRWNALAALNAGLAALTLAGVPAATAAGLGRRRGKELGLAFALSVWGVSADPIFFDLYGPNHPPFSDKVGFLIEAITSPNRNMWIPEVGR